MMPTSHTASYDVTAELYVTHPDQSAAARTALASLAAATRGEPGCLLFEVHQDKADPRRFMLWESFRSEAAFQQHLAESHTQAYFATGLSQVLKAIKSERVR